MWTRLASILILAELLMLGALVIVSPFVALVFYTTPMTLEQILLAFLTVGVFANFLSKIVRW